MTEVDPPYTCPNCGHELEFIKNRAGQWLYVKIGWSRLEDRNRMMDERYRQLVGEGRPKMICQRIVAQEFCLSKKRTEAILYGQEKSSQGGH